jgi:hypothetical protein
VADIDPPSLASVVLKRAFPSDDQPYAEGHMLFRPIGQQALARAVGHLLNRRPHPMTMTQIFERLQAFDRRGGLRLSDPHNPWWGVMYDARKETLITRNEVLASEILSYMLGGESDASQRDHLLDRFARARKITEQEALDLNGRQVPVEAVRLPELL